MSNGLRVLPYPRLCSNCERGYMGGGGVFCTEFGHLIEDERVAAECGAFDDMADHVAVTVDGAVVEQANTSATGGVAVEGMTSEELIAACERYLADRHITLWGQPFEIISPRGRREAAVWLAQQVHGLSSNRAVQ